MTFGVIEGRNGLAVTIFVWNPHGSNVGHAALSMTGGTYISWWPIETMFGGQAHSSSIRLDRQRERADKSKPPRNPDYASAPITDLDEGAIARFWEEMSGRSPDDPHASRMEPRRAHGNYNLFGENCANMVVRALFDGGLPTVYPLAASIIAQAPMVTPLLVRDIAEAMTGGAGSKLSAIVKHAVVGPLTLVGQYGGILFD